MSQKSETRKIYIFLSSENCNCKKIYLSSFEQLEILRNYISSLPKSKWESFKIGLDLKVQTV